MLFVKRRKHIKIYILSIAKVNNFEIKVKYVLKPIIYDENYKGYFIIDSYLKNIEIFNKLKIGKWLKVDLDDKFNIICVFK